MTEFITRCCHSEKSYEVIIKTDSEEHYKATQDFARRLIDHAKPMTNADRIRAMTDEELCDFLSQYKFCDICEEGCDNCTYHGDCDKRLLDWLKQPAEGDA